MINKFWISKDGLKKIHIINRHEKDKTELIEVVKLSDYNKDIRKLTLKIIHLENDIKKREEDFKETIDKKYVLKSHLKLAFISRKELKEEIEKFECFLHDHGYFDETLYKEWMNFKKQLGI